MTPVVVASVDPGPPWTVVSTETSPFSLRCQLRRGPDLQVGVLLERCATGALRDAYPVSEHDLRVATDRDLDPGILAELLATYGEKLSELDPQCRRLVYAAPEGDITAMAAAEQADFRYVVDVDIGDDSFSLMVAEPQWVTAVDMDLDRVPQT